MVIRQRKLTRSPIKAISNGQILDMAPGWAFYVESANHGRIDFDCSWMRLRERDDIGTQFRDAIWSLRFESEGISLLSYYNAAKRFWQFLDDLEDFGVHIRALNQVNRALIDDYLSWMNNQIIKKSHANAGAKLTIAAQRTLYTGLKKLLTNRRRLNPSETSLDWEFPMNPFPNAGSLRKKRSSYSQNEHKQILAALNRDLQSISKTNEEPLPSLQVLIVYLLSFGTATGVNLQSLLELRRDSLEPHPLPDREILRTSKRRGWTSLALSVRKLESTPDARDAAHTIPSAIGDHFRNLTLFTKHLAAALGSPLGDFIFLWQVSRGKRKGQIIRLTRLEAKTGIRDFCRRHKLIDDFGAPLLLCFSRLRPTFATELYQRTRDIRKVSQALGHSSAEITTRHYVSLSGDSDRDHSIVVEGMTSAFTKRDFNGRVMLAADGGRPVQTDGLLKGGYNTGIARCQNPFREDESVCKKFLTCFRCPNMLVLEDDLWRLFSFYYRLLKERPKMRADHWLKTYGPIIRRIDEDIAPHFPSERVHEARQRAISNPHPTWRSPL